LARLSASQQEQGDDAGSRRIYPALPAACPSGRLPPDPPLRLPRQPSSRRQTRLMPQAARCSRSHWRRQRLFRRRSEPMPLLWWADGADRPVSAIVACKPAGLARQLMNAALSISRYLRPPLSPPRAENAALLSRLRQRVQFAARVGGVQHAIGAFCRWQRAAKSAPRLVGITIGHIGVERALKSP